MNKFNALCRTTGCPSFILPAYILSEELELVNVTCGSCGQQITDITNLGIDSSDSSV